ncbi:MAG TPA: ZIP family metal transporter [Bacillales bacterium]|nr:ZIP family metal transporter [Bacillales bacterium]
MSWGIMGYVLAAAAANVVGGFIIFIKKDWSERGINLLLALSAGLLLAITLVDLIPEVMADSESSPIYILASVAVVFLLQQYFAPHGHGGEQVHAYTRSRSTVTGIKVGMSIHTFFDGFSIVAGFALDITLGIAVFIAIILHKIPDGVTISSVIFSLTRDKLKAVNSALLLGGTTFAGGLIAWLLTGVYFPNETMLIIALSVSAGIFLYVACAELLPAVNEAGDRLLGWFVIAGAGAYFLLHWILGQLGPHVH